MQKGDRTTELILQTLSSNSAPLETKEVLELVQKQSPATRAIVFKRLTNLRGDGLIKGKQIGCGKGTWIWWNEKAIKTGEKLPEAKHEKFVDKILQVLTTTPSETKEVEERVISAIPKSTRAIVFKRLTNLRGDGAIKGKPVGSGKGTWIWWRTDER